jgi:hypothetical protein
MATPFGGTMILFVAVICCPWKVKFIGQSLFEKVINCSACGHFVEVPLYYLYGYFKENHVYMFLKK